VAPSPRTETWIVPLKTPQVRGFVALVHNGLAASNDPTGSHSPTAHRSMAMSRNRLTLSFRTETMAEVS